MAVPERQRRLEGRHALVDGIPFEMPVHGAQSPVMLAAFTINGDKARRQLPGNELFPVRLWGNRSLLLITVIDYRATDIGKYIEFSIGIACTHGDAPAPPFLPGLFMKYYGTGQYVVDLPVSTEVSVKGGKGIWGMPKHQANLDFIIDDRAVSSQYDKDGQMVMRIDIGNPGRAWVPLSGVAPNYCQFRGMLMKSYIYFDGKFGFSLFPRSGGLTLGDHPRAAALKSLDIARRPLLTAFFPSIHGVLDDYFEGWFLTHDEPPMSSPEGLESVSHLQRGEDWLPPPNRKGSGKETGIRR